MWPKRVDFSQDESRRKLRQMELDSYSNVVSVFRAQGELSDKKKTLLKELRNQLSIPLERHKAEVRRAVNDEKLTTIADYNSPSSSSDCWLIEGRRLVPLLPRLVPQTALTPTANQAAKEAAERNSHLLNPALTGNKELANQSSVPSSAAVMATAATKPSRPTSPSSNVVVLPSGTSIHIKGMLNPDEEEEPLNRRQRRSLSIEGMGTATAQTQTARVIYTTASSTPAVSASPVKITISKSPQGRAIVSQPGGQPPKVILVTSSNQSSASSVYQRSGAVPVIRASTATSTSHSGTTRTSIIIPGSPSIVAANTSSVPGVITVTTNSITTSTSGTVTMPTSVVGGSPLFSPSVSISKPRPKVVTRQRLPTVWLRQPAKPGVVIPMGPGGSQPVAPSPQHNIQVKTVAKQPPPVHHIKQEGMKIITHAGANRILPKPTHQLTASPGTPVVVVNAGGSASGGGNTTVTMVPKTVSTFTTSTGSKVFNIHHANAGRVLANTKAPNVVTVNPKASTLQLTAVKSAAGGTTVSKPNVIVVQKTSTKRPAPSNQIPKGGTTLITNSTAFEKELANFIQKESVRQMSVSISPSGTVASAAAVGGRSSEQHRVIITTTGNADPNRQGTVQKLVPTDAENRQTLLAELVQASDPGSEAAGFETNDWLEYDDRSADPLPASTVQTLMGLHNAGAKIVQRSVSSDDHSGGSSEHFYPIGIEQALLNSDTSESATVISQAVPRIISCSSGEQRILTSQGGIPRRLSASLVTGQGMVQTVRTDMEGPSGRPGDLMGIQQYQQSGELDPQTGLFYNSGGTAQQIMVRDGSILSSQVPVSVARPPPPSVTETKQVSPLPMQPAGRQIAPNVISVPVVCQPSSQPANQPANQPMDLLSSSLAEAQINLESFMACGLDQYGPMETDSGAMMVAGGGDDFVDQHQFEVGDVGNFDTSNAILDQSDAGQVELRNAVQSVAPQMSTTLPVSDILTAQQQPQQQQYQQQQPVAQPAATVSRVPGRASTFIPLEEAKGSRATAINVVTHDQIQRDLSAAASLSSTVASNCYLNSNSSNTVVPSTAVLHNSKVLTPPTISTPTVSISLSPSITQPSPSARLSPLPPNVTLPSLSQNSMQSGVVSVLPQNMIAHSSGTTFVSVTSASLVRNTVAPKSAHVTASPLSHTVVLENSASSTGSDSVPRTLSATNSVSSAVVVTSNTGVIGRNVAVLGDGYLPTVNSRTDGHAADNLTLLPLGEAGAMSLTVTTSNPSSLVDYSTLANSAIIDTDLDLLAVGDAGPSDKTADGLSYDAISLRQSKRKRKPPSALEEAAGGSAGGSWVKAATNILNRVSRFRGSNREKGELNAAAWFTQPVDQADAPDYYSIIKKPMDFSTIRKRLDERFYTQFEDFHADMQLVRDNCFLYNAANTRVYQDCTQVFRFYQQEIDRLLDKSAPKVPAAPTGTPPKKIIRIDKSPGKS